MTEPTHNPVVVLRDDDEGWFVDVDGVEVAGPMSEDEGDRYIREHYPHRSSSAWDCGCCRCAEGRWVSSLKVGDRG